jgi:hypothetical protein
MSLNRHLYIDTHIQTLTVASSAHGWDVVVKEDSCIISRIHRQDWQKVEADLMLFEIRARDREHAGAVDPPLLVSQ